MENYIAEKGFPPNAQKVLDKYKDKTIARITIMKYKIPSVSDNLIKSALKWYKREPSYEHLYHYGLMFKTVEGYRVMIEKNHRIMVNDDNTGFMFPNDVERFIIDIPHEKRTTLQTMIDNAIQYQGKTKFFYYKVADTNCEEFARAFLIANNLLSPEAKAFTSQQVYQDFDGLDTGKSVINSFVDIGAYLDSLWHGGSLSESNGLSNTQIEKMLENVPNFKGCFCKDQIPNNLRYNDWVVLNMEDHDKGNGTHWVCFKYGNPICYYDSFAVGPPIQVLKIADRNLIFNDKQIQDMDSSACGWFCVACILYDHEQRHTDTRTHFIRFLNMFSNDTTKNDRILKRMLRKLMFPYDPSLMA